MLEIEQILYQAIQIKFPYEALTIHWSNNMKIKSSLIEEKKPSE